MKEPCEAAGPAISTPLQRKDEDAFLAGEAVLAQASDRQREEKKARLAAALRENLKRRKAQARAAAGAGQADETAIEGEEGPERGPKAERGPEIKA